MANRYPKLATQPLSFECFWLSSAIWPEPYQKAKGQNLHSWEERNAALLFCEGRDDQGFSKDGAVTAGGFGAIECLVGEREKEFHGYCCNRGGESDGTDADGDRERACLRGEGAAADGLTDLLGTVQKRVVIEGLLPQVGRAILVAIREENEELLTAVSAHQIARAGATGQTAGYLAQDFIANEMAVVIIHLLEVIDVAQEQGNRTG